MRPRLVSTPDVGLPIKGRGDRGLPAFITLGYRTNDPYAVTLTFTDRHGRVVLRGGVPHVWTVSREILAEAMRHNRPAGDVSADFRVEPLRDVTRLHFASVEHVATAGRLTLQPTRAEIDVNPNDLRLFLRKTFELVAAGHEERHLDVDGALATLFGRPSR